MVKLSEKIKSTLIVFYWVPRDLIKSTLLVIFSNRYIERFALTKIIPEYEASSLTPEISLAIKKIFEAIGAIRGPNLYERTGKLSAFYVGLFYYLNSKAYDQVRWLKKTRFMFKLNNDVLVDFYDSPVKLNYSQIEKLASVQNNVFRLQQFEKPRSRSFQSSAYLEVGGSTGLLPLVAALLGAKTSINFEYSSRLRKEGELIAERLELDNYTSCAEMPLRSDFDFVSCHQVLEHVLDPKELLDQIYAVMNPGATLFLSVGFHAFPHPGHFPLVGTLEDLFESCNFTIIESAAQNGGLFELKK